MNIDIGAANSLLMGKAPQQIIEWALQRADKPLITTNFRPYEAVILHMVTQIKPDIEVLWVDSGYSSSATYHFAEKLMNTLHLNIKVYVPAQTSARRSALMNGIPELDSPLHDEFTRQVKLEPFQRALADLQPDVWLNAIRQDQTVFRQGMNIVDYSKEGVVKVAPLFYWNDAQLDTYLAENSLPNEQDYVDPTKGPEHRECGLHTRL